MADKALATTNITAIAPDDFSPQWKKRFWSKVDRTGECWEWSGGTSGNGYGSVCTKALPGPQRRDYAHRLVWMFTVGPIPAGKVVCHRCDNPACVRPDHLFLGTQLDNVRDMIAKGRSAPPSNMRLTDSDVEQIRQEYATGNVTYAGLAERYGVVFQHIHAIVRGKKRTRKAA